MPASRKVLPIRRVTPARRRRVSLGSRRQRRFLLGVKLLIKTLEASDRPLDRLTALQIKDAVRECVRQTRTGDKAAKKLQPTLEARLRDLVGHGMFVRTMVLVDFYQTRMSLRH